MPESISQKACVCFLASVPGKPQVQEMALSLLVNGVALIGPRLDPETCGHWISYFERYSSFSKVVICLVNSNSHRGFNILNQLYKFLHAHAPLG